MNDDDDILAAEYALGLAESDDATATERRMRQDTLLALRIDWWRDQFSGMVDDHAVAPARDLWPLIERRLVGDGQAQGRPIEQAIANDNNIDGAVRRWQWATGGMTAIAAALLAFIVLRPPPAPVVIAAAPPVTTVAFSRELVASLSDKSGSAVTVSFTREGGRLLITPVTLDPGKGDAQLWVIPAGKSVPVSLGLIDAHTPGITSVDRSHAALIAPGATIAISQEAKGGSTDGTPHGQIVAAGKIILV